MAMKLSQNDEAVVALAIAPDAQERYRSLLANPKKRKKILDTLNHKPRLNEKRTTWFSSTEQAIDSINVKPDKSVYLLSDSPELDGKTMPYAQAISKVVLEFWGTIILISPNLAFYYGESGERVAIIRADV